MYKKNVSQKLKVCIVGPGVVGLATGKALLAKKIRTEFLGGREERINKLREEGFIVHERKSLMDGDYDFDISMLTVPTPTQNNKIDLSAMNEASIDLGKRLRKTKKYHVVVVKSTVPPGTTEELVIKNVEKYSDKLVGRDFGAVMNPEYLREETAYDDTLNAWLIVIGEYDKKSGDYIAHIYKNFICPIHRVAITEAEMQKYVHNLYNATKITFFNEMREVAGKIGADAEKMFKLVALSAEGMWNPKYGIRNRGPFSGSCLPKDTKAFLHWAKTRGHDMQLLKSVVSVNESHVAKNGFKNANLQTEYTI